MTWSYNPEMGQTRDKVRLLIGDTDDSLPQFENEELEWFLSENGSNVYRAAASACQALASKYSSMVDKEVGDLKIWASQRASAYRAAQKDFELKGGSNAPAVVPYAGGQTRSDKLIDQQDPDNIQPYFKPGQMTQPPGDHSDNSSNVWTRA